MKSLGGRSCTPKPYCTTVVWTSEDSIWRQRRQKKFLTLKLSFNCNRFWRPRHVCSSSICETWKLKHQKRFFGTATEANWVQKNFNKEVLCLLVSLLGEMRFGLRRLFTLPEDVSFMALWYTENKASLGEGRSFASLALLIASCLNVLS